MLRYHPTLAHASSLWHKRPIPEVEARDNTIYITDIMVINGEGHIRRGKEDKAYGEYHASLFSGTKIPTNETDAFLLARMLEQIHTAVTAVKMIRITDNHIFRYLFPEFYFYPKLERGPIQSTAFNTFIADLRKLASNLPSNTHIHLASFPVFNTKRVLFNEALYVECGEQVKIHRNAKSWHDYDDLHYVQAWPGYYMQYHLPNKFIYTIEKLLLPRLLREIIDDPNNAKVSLNNFFSQCCAHPDFKPTDERLREKYDHLEGAIEFYGNLISGNTPHTQQELNGAKHQLRNSVELLLNAMDDVVEMNTKFIRKARKKPYLPVFALQTNGEAIESTTHQCVINTTTTGGVSLDVVVDMCVDYELKFGLLHYEAYLREATKNYSRSIPIHLSHVVTSNTLTLKKPGFASEITHVDPYRPGICKFENGKKQTTSHLYEYDLAINAFGQGAKLCIFNTRKLEPLTGCLRKRIDTINFYNHAKRILLLQKTGIEPQLHAEAVQRCDFILALASKNIKEFKRLMQSENNLLDIQDEAGNSLLHLAIDLESHAIAQIIIEYASLRGDFSILTRRNAENETPHERLKPTSDKKMIESLEASLSCMYARRI